MSAVAIQWAREQRCGGATLKALLITVALHANDDGSCQVSHRGLAEVIELDPRTVREALKALEVAGYLHRERLYHDDGGRAAERLHLHLANVRQAAGSRG